MLRARHCPAHTMLTGTKLRAPRTAQTRTAAAHSAEGWRHPMRAGALSARRGRAGRATQRARRPGPTGWSGRRRSPAIPRRCGSSAVPPRHAGAAARRSR